MRESRRKRSKSLVSVLTLALAIPAIAFTPQTASEAVAQDVKPVVIRLAADHTPPPHPAAIAQQIFGKRLAEEIPGSELRLYHAGALYTIPEAVEAMAEGNLEMKWVSSARPRRSTGT
jgi:TRAP-type C4-dicarboxylate transport system substrate-binding protein